jgi:hypothetical protein
MTVKRKRQWAGKEEGKGTDADKQKPLEELYLARG